MLIEKNMSNKDRIQIELNKFKSILGVSELSEAADYFPKFIQIETTRLCNAKCPFCPQDVWDKSTPYMSDKLFNKIIEELKKYKDWINWVCVQKAGEPLLDKKIADKIKQLKDIGIKHVMMSTNASLLTSNKSKELILAGLDEIMFSIDSIIPEEYQKMRVGLDFHKVIENIKTFMRIRDELNPDLIVRIRGVSFFDTDTIDGKKDLDDWEKFWEKLKKSNDRVYMKKAHNWGNQKVWEGHSPDAYEGVFYPCIIPWSTMTISAMGIVGLCVQDYDSKMNLGDLNTQKIREVWRSDKYKKIRNLHLSGKRDEISYCDGCIVYDQDHTLEKK